ncbi:hypothetical protein PR048_015548 [Dryococelus australis]|uniref:Uncharacterized protein n=1 Tax=Dryococelus australis TaxID=614101 RepID=A0ABQ9HH96_9NEOP|nr:hypothetical protein PR048_015548 [Dryococelus australis]
MRTQFTRFSTNALNFRLGATQQYYQWDAHRLGKILKTDLRLHPYEIVCLFVCVCVCKNNNIEITASGKILLCKMHVLFHGQPEALIFMSDRAHFLLNGFFNQQNCTYLGRGQSETAPSAASSSPNVSVIRWLSAPSLFEENRLLVTVTANHLHVINIFFLPELQRAALKNVMVSAIRGYGSHRQGNVISSFGDVPWPPRSPDSRMCDFFVRVRVYQDTSLTLNDLKAAIHREVVPINGEIRNQN